MTTWRRIGSGPVPGEVIGWDQVTVRVPFMNGWMAHL